MGQLKSSYITDAGRQLLFSGKGVTYTKAILYAQDLSTLTVPQIKAITSLDKPLMSTDLVISDEAKNTIKVEATFQNAGLKADLPFESIGFFAKPDSGDEVLTGIVVASPGAYLGAGSPDGVSTDAINVGISMAVGDATTVTAQVDPAGAVTQATLSSEIAKASQDLQAKIDSKADKSTVDEAIGKIDFSPYAKTADVNSELSKKANSSDVYTRDQVDSKISAGGKVQTVNGNKPDSSGNVKVDLSGLESKDDFQKEIASLKSELADTKTTITSLQSALSTQSQELTYIKANYIEGKVFPKGDEKDAIAWTKANAQKLAIISDLKK